MFDKMKLLLVAVFVGTVWSYPATHKKARNDVQNLSGQDVCVSEPCIETSYNILKSINTSVDPCDDFYEFACGQYLTNTRIPDDKSRWSHFDSVAEEIYLQGKSLLEEVKTPGEFESYQLARDYYKSCSDEDGREKLGLQPLMTQLEKIGGWPVLDGEVWKNEESFKWWDWIYMRNRAGFGINSLLTFSLGADDKNASYRVLGFDQATLGLSREFLIKGFEEKEVQYYYHFMVNTSVLLGANREFAEKDLKESLLFEISLAKINAPKEERRNATSLYNPTTLGDMPTFEGLPPSWTEYVKTIYELADQVKIDESERVILTNVEYFEKLANLIKETKPRILANYLGWQSAKTVLSYLNDQAFQVKQVYEKQATGVEKPAPIWKRCVNVVGFNSLSGSFSLGLIAGSMYVQKYFKPEAKAAMLEMTSYIRTSFKEDILGKIDWMDENTKSKALQKLDQMDQFIAYGDEFLDRDKVDGVHKGLVVTPEDYLANTLTIIKFWRNFYYKRLREKIDPKSWLEHADVSVVNAFYSGDANNIEFPAGILQGAFFNGFIPRYMNFGAIGSIIGHEITHGFDDKGKQRNGLGEIENWWEPQTEANFKEKAQCIIDQYGNYTDQSVGININGINSQGENIADNGGLKEAYKAYLRWVKDNEEEPRLVGLDYTPKQMFWISYGHVWCFKYRDAALKQQILTGFHSPGRYRILGSISNNVDFSKDFNCPIGSKMNPEKKCSVW